MKYVARIDWHPQDYNERWNEMLARCVAVFGLPCDDRYVTCVDADYMDFIFCDEADRLLFLTGWPAHIPDATPISCPGTRDMHTDVKVQKPLKL